METATGKLFEEWMSQKNPKYFITVNVIKIIHIVVLIISIIKSFAEINWLYITALFCISHIIYDIYSKSLMDKYIKDYMKDRRDNKF